ncbi:MAG: manganese efflux pump MntP family protein [Candidatus Spyradocola sp.]|nr:manganese efflux pump MntP family protein [Candidatus Spyradocola sp.]
MLHYALLAASLAADAFAVAISMGLSAQKASFRDAVRVGLFFGGFQALMPLLGYLAGSTVSAVIERYDHWIAFGLLAFIGGRMLWESARGTEEGGQPSLGALRKLLVLSIATSIDALAVGVSLAVLRENIWVNAAWVGCVTFALSTLGVLAGRRLGRRMQRCATVAGGLVLIFIGAKILIEHLG